MCGGILRIQQTDWLQEPAELSYLLITVTVASLVQWVRRFQYWQEAPPTSVYGNKKPHKISIFYPEKVISGSQGHCSNLFEICPLSPTYVTHKLVFQIGLFGSASLTSYWLARNSRQTLTQIGGSKSNWGLLAGVFPFFLHACMPLLCDKNGSFKWVNCSRNLCGRIW